MGLLLGSQSLVGVGGETVSGLKVVENLLFGMLRGWGKAVWRREQHEQRKGGRTVKTLLGKSQVGEAGAWGL